MVVRLVICYMEPNAGQLPRVLSTLSMLWITGVSLLNHYCNDTIWWQMGIVSITEKMWQRRLWSFGQWYGHILRAASGTVANNTYHFTVDGKRPSGQPKQRWQDTMEKDMRITKLHSNAALDCAKWNAKI